MNFDPAGFIENYHWVLQAFLVIFAALVADLGQRRLLARLEKRLLTKTSTPWDEAVVNAVRRPLTLLIWVFGIAFAVQIAGVATSAFVFQAVGPLREIGVVAALTWFLVRLIRNGENAYLSGRAGKSGGIDRATLDAVGKLLRISVFITA
ncbi:MAG: mechanosensitive ion channel family protein, partial [bacterium]